MRFLPLVVCLMLSAGCGFKGCRSAPPDEPASMECARSAPLVLRGVDLCEGAASIDQSGSAQLLIDASGSMAGFTNAAGQRSALTRVHEWVASALSGLGGDQKTIVLRRVAAFNRVDGTVDLTPRAIETLRPRGDTTLDRAVQEADSADLSVIVTDGVPFVGREGAEDCAAGADPGCVARRLLEYAQQRTSAGVELVPIVAAYDGAFFSEGQDVPPDAAAAAVIEENVKRAFPRSDVRLALRPGATPPMVYRGPRVLLMFVLAGDERLSRAFLRLLMERAPLAQVQSLEEDWSAFDNRERLLGVMTPVEVYPGYLPAARQIEGARVGEAEGTIDVASRGAGEQLAVEVGCRAGDEGSARYRLSFFARPRGGAPCRKLHSLASVTLSLCPKDEASDAERQALGATVREVSYDLDGDGRASRGSALPVTLGLACGPLPGPECAAGGAPLRLAATLEYAASAERLAAEAQENAERAGDAVDYVIGLSTSDLPRNPHRVLGLGALLTQFLRGAASGARSHPVGVLTVCERREER